MKVLVVAESDSYLKWSAHLVQQHFPGDDVRFVSIGRTAPSARQVEVALSETSAADRDVAVASLVTVLSELRAWQPDWLIGAVTGPTLAVLSAATAVISKRTLVLSGLPGIALPLNAAAVSARRLADVFVAHSEVEREAYLQAFDGLGSDTRVALASFPFFESDRPVDPSSDAVVFAPQPSVPAAEADRRQILVDLAGRAERVIIKLRSTDGEESATHDEAHPYPELYADLVGNGTLSADSLEFRSGSMSEVLDTASALITVSSTAAIEAVSRGCPTLVIDDLGVSAALLNTVFESSGLCGSAATGIPTMPTEAWSIQNYSHAPKENDLPAVLRSRAGTSASRTAWKDKDFRTAWKDKDFRIAMLTGIRRLMAAWWKR